jgi:hypothetical protein
LDGLDQDGLQAAVPFGTYACVWLGLTAAWNDPGNWSLGYLPAYQTNVLITDTVSYYPEIFDPGLEPAVCMNLTVTGTAVLTVESSAAFTVYGNLVLENADSTGSVQGVILKSDQCSEMTGSMIVKGTASGTVTIERYLNKNNNWHLIASPVDSQYFQPEFVPDPVDQSFDLYFWNETGDEDTGWINCRSEGGGWSPSFESYFIGGKGYLIAFSLGNSGEAVRTFTGQIRTGNYNLPLSHTGNNWNLLGNPYSNALDWSSEGISKDAVAGSAMYIWDPYLNLGQGGYRTHNGTTGVPVETSPTIPAMQGFFVQSLDNGMIAIDAQNDNPLVHGDHDYYKNKTLLTANRVRLRISNASGSDEALVCFDPQATNMYDPHLDASKLFAYLPCCPEIYTEAGEHQKLCINMLGEMPASVPVSILYPDAASLVLQAFDFDAFDPATGIFLEDLSQGTWTDLRESPEFAFVHDPSAIMPRFRLHFTGASQQDEQGQPGQPEIWCSGNQVFISNPSESPAILEVYSTDGKHILDREIPAGKSTVHLPVSSGLYLVRARTLSGVITRKIFIQ